MSAVVAKIVGILLVFGIIGVGCYFLYNYIKGNPVFGVIGEITGVGKDIVSYFQTPATCDSATEESRGGLCYKKCPPGYTSDGTTMCYKDCPKDWKGKSTLAFCEKYTSYSSVGLTDTIPNQCSKGTLYAGLCYDLPDSTWKVTAPGFIGQTCEGLFNTPPGQKFGGRDDGIACWIDADTINTGAGTVPEVHCEGADFHPRGIGGASWCDNSPTWPWNLKTKDSIKECPSDRFLSAGLCYKKCPDGYTQTGTTCYRAPIRKARTVKSLVGTLPDKCPGDKELRGRLCYPKCTNGLVRTGDNIEFCSSPCPSGFTDIGVGGCKKPTENVGAGKPVHVCPAGTNLKGLFCYKN